MILLRSRGVKFSQQHFRRRKWSFSVNLQRKLSWAVVWIERQQRETSRYCCCCRHRPPPLLVLILLLLLPAWRSDGLRQTDAVGQQVGMSSGGKSVNLAASAVKAEVRRYESLQKTLVRLAKQVDRVEDEQLRSGLRVYLRSVEGKPPPWPAASASCTEINRKESKV